MNRLRDLLEKTAGNVTSKHITQERCMTPIIVTDVAAITMAEAGGEIIMKPMHIMQIMMQGLHEDMEEDLHLLMT